MKKLTTGTYVRGKPDKKAYIAGIEFKYRTPSGLLRKIWSEARSMSHSIRNMDRQRECLLKAYRQIDWSRELEEYQKHGPNDI